MKGCVKLMKYLNYIRHFTIQLEYSRVSEPCVIVSLHNRTKYYFILKLRKL